jgi:hypothetical protein
MWTPKKLQEIAFRGIHADGFELSSAPALERRP